MGFNKLFFCNVMRMRNACVLSGGLFYYFLISRSLISITARWALISVIFSEMKKTLWTISWTLLDCIACSISRLKWMQPIRLKDNSLQEHTVILENCKPWLQDKLNILLGEPIYWNAVLLFVKVNIVHTKTSEKNRMQNTPWNAV